MTQGSEPGPGNAGDQASQLDQATELAEKLRLLAESDPDRVRDVAAQLAQLVSTLEQATGQAIDS